MTSGGVKAETGSKKKDGGRETGKEGKSSNQRQIDCLLRVSRIIIAAVHTMQGGDYNGLLSHSPDFNTGFHQLLQSLLWINKTWCRLKSQTNTRLTCVQRTLIFWCHIMYLTVSSIAVDIQANAGGW